MPITPASRPIVARLIPALLAPCLAMSCGHPVVHRPPLPLTQVDKMYEEGILEASETPRSIEGEAPPAAPPARLEPESPLLDSRVTLVATDAELKTILAALARQTELSFSIAGDVEGITSVSLRGKPLRQVLKQLLEPAGYAFEVSGDFVRVFKPPFTSRVYDINYTASARSGTKVVTVVDRETSSTAGMGFTAFGMYGAGGSGGVTPSGTGGTAGTSGQAGSTGSLSTIRTREEVLFWEHLAEGLHVLLQGKPAAAGASESALQWNDGAGTSFVINPSAGTVTVRARESSLGQVQRYLSTVEKAMRRQVIIETRILEVTLEDTNQYNVDAKIGSGAKLDFSERLAGLGLKVGVGGAGSSTEGFSLNVTGPDLTAILSAVASSSDIDTVAAPRIAALNNQKAVVKVVRERVFFVEQTANAVAGTGSILSTSNFVPYIVPEGVVLDVTPQIADDGYVMLTVRPSISEIVNVVSTPDNRGSQPELTRRELDTVVRVGDGQTVVLGGLYSQKQILSDKGVPFLKDIPVLGYFFRSTEMRKVKTELVLLLTPRVQRPGDVKQITGKFLKRLGETRPDGSEQESGGSGKSK